MRKKVVELFPLDVDLVCQECGHNICRLEGMREKDFDRDGRGGIFIQCNRKTCGHRQRVFIDLYYFSEE